ncbi:MAG TPA: ABC transporter permease, partial [Treponemataceae bacterium]|nr:ABC transporter permease [Treponemataceae bacterium]
MNAFAEFALGPFSSLWHAGNLLDKAGLLMFASTGAAFALKSGTFNLGGEAQIYASALVTAMILS